jgi:peroxiredoxin
MFSCNKHKVVLKKIESSQQKKESAPTFSLPNQYGDTINLSDFKGNILLLDFWASWCPPCRKENPNMVDLYKKYNSKGLQILSVSLDSKNEKWLSAIKDDGLIWTNVSELKEWESQVVDLYKINSIPHTVLINKEGNIVAEKLLGKELEFAINLLIE